MHKSEPRVIHIGCKLNNVNDLVDENIDIITINVLNKTMPWNPIEVCRIRNSGANVEVFAATTA